MNRAPHEEPHQSPDDSGEQPPSPRVVVDTSVLRQSNGDLERGDWPTLLAAARLDYCSLEIPQVVLQELVDHRRRDLTKLQKMSEDLDREHRRLVPRRATNLSRQTSRLRLHIEHLCDQYTHDVTTWFTEAGSVLDDPDVSHRELVDRLLAGRKPFTTGEKGYRDALIWHSVLEQAASHDVVLLTANTRDFATKTDGGFVLADDLQEDLTTRGLPADRVHLATTTGDLLSRVLPSDNEQDVTAAWSSFAATATFAATLERWVEDRFYLPISSPTPEAPSWLWGIGIRSVETITAAHTAQIVEDGDGWYRVHARLTGTGRIGGFAWAWATPSEERSAFVLWDDWGGMTEYHASDETTEIDLEIAARWRPLVELEEAEIVAAKIPGTTPTTPEVNRLNTTLRAMKCLQAMLATHADNPDFLSDIQDNAHLVKDVLAEWESIADRVAGRYTALASDNLHTVLAEPAGLRALEEQLRSAIEATATVASDLTRD